MHGDEPDFLISPDRNATGIEHTEYFRKDRLAGSFIQEQESLRDQIVETAAMSCVERRLPAVWAAVFFSCEHRLTKRDVAPVANEIVKLVASCDPSWAGKITNDGQLPRFIDDIILYRSEGLKEPMVTTTDAIWVPEIEHEELQAIANQKEPKVSKYRHKCTRVWLLIEVNGFRLSSMAKLPSALPVITSSFDRIFVLHDGRTVVELAVTAA